MTSRIAQRAFLGLAVVAALLFATGCDNPVDPPAATVDGVKISRDDLFNEAEALAALPNYAEDFATGTNNALNGVMVANVLSGQIATVIYDQQAKRSGLELDDAAIAAARAQLGSDADALPEDVANELARRTAIRQLVLEHVTSEQWWTDADVERYHARTKEQACTSHILVDTEEEAEELLGELRDGADFGELAEEHSTDTVSGSDGGNLGCQPRGAFIPEFEAAVDSADNGEIVGPVRTSAGVHIILVEEAYHPVSLDDAREGIEALFANPDGSGWADYVLKTTDVSVDPRFGTWDAGQVLPPEGARPAASSGALPVS